MLLPADVVFAIDESASMGPAIADVKANVSTIAGSLSAGGLDPRLGLVGYGAGGRHDPAGFGPHLHAALTDVAGFDSALDELRVSGGTEPALDTTVFAMSDVMGFRTGAGVCLVLVTDEVTNGDRVSAADALAALQSRDATFFAIGPEPGGLAGATGGATVEISTFRGDPTPILDALIQSCVGSIVEGINLVPITAEQTVGQTHTVTALVKDSSAAPVAGAEVTFEILSGPHAGTVGSGTTNEAGEVEFAYPGSAEGVDTIRASFTDSNTQEVKSETAEVTWMAAPNQPPVAVAGGPYTTDEGQSVVLTAGGSFDPDADPLTYEWDLDGDGSFETSGMTVEVVFGDNGTYPVDVRVTDPTGETDVATVSVVVRNIAPTVVLDTSDATAFPATAAFVGTAGSTQTHSADATDPGSDDLTFEWQSSTEPSRTYFNDGTGPDPETSPAGVFPFAASDTATLRFDSVGVTEVVVTVTDDDGGVAVQSLPKVILGDCGCTLTQGFWDHQFSRHGRQHVDDQTLAAYLEIINLVSMVFDDVDLSAADEILVPADPSKRDKARSQLLAAWLNYANGGLYADELVDTDEDGMGDTTFLEVITEAETILADPAGSHDAQVRAKDLAEAINLSRHCEDH